MVKADYQRFCDDVLVACADAQVGSRVRAVNIGNLCAKLFPDAPPTWVQMVTKTLVDCGYGKDWSTMQSKQFYIEGNGLLEAARIRAERRPASFWTKFDRANWTKWSALIAFIGIVVTILIAVVI